VSVGRSVESVWEYVVAGFFEHHGAWDPAVVGMTRLDDGPLSVGSRGRERRRFAGTQEADFTVTELTRLQAFAFRNTTGPFALDRRYDFRADGSGATVVAFEFDMAPRGAMRLLFPLLRPVIRRQVRANIDRIPALVEAAEPSTHL
jgi:hypothetical protein